MRKTKAEKGITLVALIITIIVLLILAVVAINAVRDDGIIDYAKNARTEYEKAQAEEQALLDYYTSQIQSSIGTGVAHGGIIPEKGKYKRATGEELGEGEYFPDGPQDGDIYEYGDYIYCYNRVPYANSLEWTEDANYPNFGGWGVRVKDKGLTSYGEILTTINGKNVTNMYYTFVNCTELVKAPSIPSTVKIMKSTFGGCLSLVTVPIIPNNVTDMSYMFMACSSLQSAPQIPSNVTNMYRTFWGCTSLTGDVVIKTTKEKIDLTNEETYKQCFYILNTEGTTTNEIYLVGIDENNDNVYDNLDILNALAETDEGNVKSNVTVKSIS